MFTIVINHLLLNCHSKHVSMIKEAFDLLLGVVKSSAKEIDVESFTGLWKEFQNSSNKNLLLG